jgi:quinol monooxygenase YgiN
MVLNRAGSERTAKPDGGNGKRKIAMIHAAVTVVASPAQRKGILRSLRSLLNPTRVEPGCVYCHLYKDVEQAGAFTLVEAWATSADFERRLRSEAYRQLLLTLELSAKPPDVQFQVVTETMGLEAVHASRRH